MGIKAFQSAVSKQGVPTNTAISLVVDRSGSMSPYVKSVVDSVFHFITEQQEVKGKAVLTLSQFDHDYEVLYRNKDIKEVDADEFGREYHTRGATNLRDAIVKSVKDMQDQLDDTPAAERAKRVVVALITDGADTGSYNSVEKVRQIIQEKEKMGWDFMLLGADGVDILETAKDLGISGDKTAVYQVDNPGAAIKLLSQKVAQARRGKEVTINQQERLALMSKKEEL